jgi:hypothetical protein
MPTHSPIEFETEFMCFTLDHSERAAVAAFTARYGHAPQEIIRDDYLRLGPVTDDAMPIPSEIGVALSHHLPEQLALFGEGGEITADEMLELQHATTQTENQAAQVLQSGVPSVIQPQAETREG